MRIGPIPTIINDFRYIPENDIVCEILGWTTSNNEIMFIRLLPPLYCSLLKNMQGYVPRGTRVRV